MFRFAFIFSLLSMSFSPAFAQVDVGIVDEISIPDTVLNDSIYYPKLVIQNYSPQQASGTLLVQRDSSGSIIWFNTFQFSLDSLQVDTLTFNEWIPNGNCQQDYSYIFQAFATGDINSSNDLFTKNINLTKNGKFIDVANLAIPNANLHSFLKGAAWGDLNNDGWLDLVALKYDSLYTHLNLGNGTFSSNISDSLGLTTVNGNTVNSIIIADMDNNSYSDIIAGYDILLHNGDDLNPYYSSSNVDIAGFTGATFDFSVGDLDNDSFLDLCVGRYANYDFNDLVFHNQGFVAPTNKLTFIEIANQLNISYPSGHQNYLLQKHTGTVTCVDYNQDGWVDIYFGHDDFSGQFNRMYENNKLDSLGNINQFSFVSNYFDNSGLGKKDTRSSAFGDFNNDGLVDVFLSTTNYYGQLLDNILLEQGISPITNLPKFYDVSNGSGVIESQPTKSYESGWADFNNDGWLDLFVGNFGYNNFSSKLYLNKGVGNYPQFESVPLIDNYFGARNISWVDYNNDGLMDIFLSRVNDYSKLLKNDICSDNNWIQFDLVGTQSNVSAIGTHLKLYTGGMLQYRQIIAGSGFSMESLRVEFGLGQNTYIDSLVIDWPSGIHQTVYDIEVEINSINEILEVDCKSTPKTNLETIKFAGNTSAGLDSVELVLTNEKDCSLFIYDIQGKFPYNAIFSTDKTTFEISPQGSDTIQVYYTQLYDQMTTSLQIFYKGFEPLEIPIVVGNCMEKAIPFPSYLNFQYLPITWEDSTQIYLQNTNSNCKIFVENLEIPSPYDTIWSVNQSLPFSIDENSSYSFWVKRKSPGPVNVFSELKIKYSNFQSETIVPLLINECLPNVQVSTSQLDFGQTEIGKVDTLQFTISNQDSSCNYLVLDFEIPSQFDSVFSTDKSLLPEIIPSGSQQSFNIFFKSTSLDSFSTILTIKSNLPSNSEITLTGVGIVTSIESEKSQLPIEFSLTQNYPNPFNPTTRIEFGIPQESNVQLQIFNIKGRLVKELVNSKLNAGFYNFDWNGTGKNGSKVSSGIYFYKLKTDKFSQTKKMILLK